LNAAGAACNIVLQKSLAIPMTVTVRLRPELRHQLESYCRKYRLTKSRVITELLEKHFDSSSTGRKSAYELAREFGVVGGFSSGKGDLSVTYKRRLKERMRARHAR
jgi:hypothetical protein